MEPKKPRKTIEEQEQAIQEKLSRLEQKKKRLATIKDKQRTRRLILLGTLLEKSLTDAPKNKLHFARMAEGMYAKRPSDLDILKAYLGSVE